MRSWYFSKNLREASGLAAQLADARPELDRHVREAVEGLAHEAEVLGVVADVEGEELRLRVAGVDAVAGGQDLREAREVLAVERPVGMEAELVVALVEAVDGQEERLRVGDVDEDRQLGRGAGLPHRVEARIVDLDQRAAW